jgi:hypothetical protein
VLRCFLPAPREDSVHTSMQRLPAASPLLAGTANGSRLPDITFRMLDLKYHTVPAEHLARTTLRRLEETGLPSTAFGRLAGRHVTLTGCVVLTEVAQSSVPPALGGTADVFVASPSTSTLLGRAVPLSPLRGASLGVRAAPAPWLSPGAGPPGTPPPSGRGSGLPSPSSAERERLDRAMANLLAAARDDEEALARAGAAEDAARATRAALVAPGLPEPDPRRSMRRSRAMSAAGLTEPSR